MKLVHTSDLHIGKIINGFNMLKDQQFVLEQILKIVKEEEAEGLIIAGDVYDRALPPAESVAVLDWFLTSLSELGTKVFLISGNHDSPERISFAGSILEKRGLHIGGTFTGKMKKVSLEDQYGPVNLFLLPFVKPAVIRHVYCRDDIGTYEASVRTVLEEDKICKEERNILVTHHFITNCGKEPELSESESRVSTGGVDNVDFALFDDYDYVALGHIHGPQRIGRDTVRYSGSPLKYSFSETFHKKSVTILELKEKGNISLKTRELIPLHDVRRIKGELKDLMDEQIHSQSDREDYLEITLTNKEELVDPISTLRSVYPNIMHLEIEKKGQIHKDIRLKENNVRFKTTLELFETFFEYVTDLDFDQEKRKIMEQVIEEAEGGAL